MKLRVGPVIVLAASGWFAAVLARPATRMLTPTPEVEPNNTPATATPLTSVSMCQAASGSISPIGDVDYYSFVAPPGARVWAFVDTSASPAGQNDSLLTLFAPDGTTQIEQDDDDGTATSCGTTIVNQLSSAIAGRVLTAGGTYYLRVEGVGEVVTSYKLLVVVTTSATAEFEPNNTSITANPIVTSGSPIGVRNSAISPAGDVDYYSVDATAGSTLFISADGDPERDGVGTDVVVDLLQPDGSTVIISVDNSDNVGFPAPPAEAFCYAVPVSGTYFVRVSGFTSSKITTTGTYSLMVAACGLSTAPTATPTRTLTPTVTTTTVAGGPTSTPTLTPTMGPATTTPTTTSTPLGGIAPSNIPTLSFPMLLLMGLGLVVSAFLLVRRL
jgi:Bacterial pre-peptidase C-terminal domain